MIQRFFKDVVIYALPMFLARVVGLLLLPIYTRHLGPEDFGFVEFVAAASTILLLVLPLEINQAVGRLLPEADSDSRKYKIFTTALWFTVAAFGCFSLLIYVSRFKLFEVLNLSDSYNQYVALISMYFSILAIFNLIQVKFRFTNQAMTSVIINLTSVITNIALVLYFIRVDKLGLEQYFWSQIWSGFIGVTIGLVILNNQYKALPLFKYIDIHALRELLKYSFPIVLSSIGVALTVSVDKLIIGSSIGLKELGYYGAAMRLSAIVGLGFYVLSTAITPMVYREHDKPETKVFIARVFHLVSYCSIALLIVVIFFSKFLIVMFAGAQFYPASEYLFYLMLSAIVGGSYMFFLGMDIFKETKVLSKVNLTAGVLGTVTCVILVPAIGVWGAVTSAILANSARLSGYIYFSQRIYKIPVVLWRFVLPIIFLIIVDIFLKR